MTKYQQIKTAIAAALDDEKNNKVDKIVDWTIISLIIISTLEIFLSTFPAINDRISGLLHFIDTFTTGEKSGEMLTMVRLDEDAPADGE